MTVATLLATVSSRELAEWAEFYQIRAEEAAEASGPKPPGKPPPAALSS